MREPELSTDADELAVEPELLIEDLPSIYVLNEFYRVNGWDAYFRQLKPGPFRLQIAGRLINDVTLIRESYGQRFASEAQSPANVVSILLMLSGEMRMSGHVADLDTMFVIAPDAEMHFVSSTGAAALTIDVPESMFREVLQSVTGNTWPAEDGRIAAIRAGQGELEVLRTTVIRSLHGSGNWHCADDARIVTKVCRLLDSPADKSVPGNAQRRLAKNRIIDRARDYIHAHLSTDIRVPDVCRYSAASLRTLERAFKEELGVTPNQYLQAARLHEARCELQSDDTGTRTVADIAWKYGFKHMGRFSQQYRRHFGVLPSRDRDTTTI